MKKVSKCFLGLSLLFTFLMSSCDSDKKIIIHTDDAPQAIGPYSQAIVINNVVYCSGQIGIDPTTNELVSGGISQETTQIFKNINAILSASSSCLENVIKSTVYLTDMNNFTTMNDLYSTYFNEDNYPSRSVVEVSSLPKGASIEIEVIAYQNK